MSHRQPAMVDLLRRHGGELTADIIAVYRQTDLARELLAATGGAAAAELLEFAAMGGDDEIVRLALGHVDWQPDDERWFYLACQPMSFWNHIPWLYAGNPELPREAYLRCFMQLIARVDVNLVARSGRTLLHEAAAMGGHVTGAEAAAFATILLDAGARLDPCDELLHSTPLGWACRWGHSEVASLLLARGADPLEPEAEPWARPAAWARRGGHTELLALLTG